MIFQVVPMCKCCGQHSCMSWTSSIFFALHLSFFNLGSFKLFTCESVVDNTRAWVEHILQPYWVKAAVEGRNRQSICGSFSHTWALSPVYWYLVYLWPVLVPYHMTVWLPGQAQAHALLWGGTSPRGQLIAELRSLSHAGVFNVLWCTFYTFKI